MFICNEWDAIIPNHALQSLSSQCFDYAPLLLCTEDNDRVRRRFHFCSFWPRFPGFKDVVARAWHCPLGNVSPFTGLDWLLHNTVMCPKCWSDRTIGSVRLQLEMAKEIMHWLEIARDTRRLSAGEEEMCKPLKLKSLALASLQGMIARQELRILGLGEGGRANSFLPCACQCSSQKEVHSVLGA
jgi:hypothetical protein